MAALPNGSTLNLAPCDVNKGKRSKP